MLASFSFSVLFFTLILFPFLSGPPRSTFSSYGDVTVTVDIDHNIDGDVEGDGRFVSAEWNGLPNRLDAFSGWSSGFFYSADSFIGLDKFVFLWNQSVYEYSFVDQKVIAVYPLHDLFGQYHSIDSYSHIDALILDPWNNVNYFFISDVYFRSRGYPSLDQGQETDICAGWGSLSNNHCIPNDLDAFGAVDSVRGLASKGNRLWGYDFKFDAPVAPFGEPADQYFPGVDFPIDDMDHHPQTGDIIIMKDDRYWYFDPNPLPNGSYAMRPNFPKRRIHADGNPMPSPISRIDLNTNKQMTFVPSCYGFPLETLSSPFGFISFPPRSFID